jgi:hypothetical protein
MKRDLAAELHNAYAIIQRLRDALDVASRSDDAYRRLSRILTDEQRDLLNDLHGLALEYREAELTAGIAPRGATGLVHRCRADGTTRAVVFADREAMRVRTEGLAASRYSR